MKKHRILQIVAGFFLLISSVFTGVSIAWFYPAAYIGGNVGSANAMPIAGTTLSSYFGRGKGTSDSPYVITNPRHLYNLAWLQYLGYFNNENSPYYFTLDPTDSNSLNMTGWVLPPIGTSKYPFIGNFNGNNKTIENLVVDNVVDTGHITQKPSIIPTTAVDSNKILKTCLKGSDDTYTFLSDQVNIVGLFGILGYYNGMAQVSANYASANSVFNLAIDNITINSSSSTTLVGLACGYDNATLDGIAVDNSTINVATSSSATSITNNISDYSLVGYATDDAKSKCSYRADTVSLPSVVNPNTGMGGNNWGGSIAMKDIYDQLKEIRDNELEYNIATHTYSQTIVNGSTEPGFTSSEPVYICNHSTDVNQNNGGYYHQYHTGDFTEDGKVYASFTISRRTTTEQPTNSYGDNETGSDPTHVYACLDGVRTKELSATTYNITTLNSVTAGSSFYITDGKGNYLRYSSGLTNTTSFSRATQWTYDSSNRISTATGTKRYLRNNSGTLTTTTSTSNNTITWTISSGGAVSSVSGGTTYYLNCVGGTWTLETQTSSYYISDGNGNYLSAGSSSNPINKTTQADATKWVWNGTYLYAMHDTTKRIVRVDYSSTLNISDQYTNYFTIYNNNRLRSSRGNTYYYVYFDGNQWTTMTNSTNLTITSVAYTAPKLFFATQGSTNTSNKEYSTKPTFFPLMMEPATYKPMDGYVANTGENKQYNTGYVVSGNNIHTSSNFQNYTGDVRFAGFPYNGTGNSESNNSLYQFTSDKKIHTRTSYLDDEGEVVDTGWTTIDTSKTFTTENTYHLQKFKKSYASFKDTLTDSAADGHIYGVHFMDATININNKVVIPQAKVLDKPAVLNPSTNQYEDHISVYENYEAPQDSIDFYLKNYGYVNFFAGTYFHGSSGDNDSFFSLNQIFRNEYVEPSGTTPGRSTISDIKRISKIYSPVDADGKDVPADDDNLYEYLYSDGTYSSTGTATAPEHVGKLLFDTDWIEKPSRGGHNITMYSLYYFEIPVNAGEYALGSVSGTNGCYLNYLDIGAGAPAFKDVITTEKIVSDISNMSFPLGVDFVDLDNLTSLASAIAAIVGGDSAIIELTEGTGGDVKYAYTTTTTNSVTTSALSITKPGNDPPDLKLVYKALGVSVTYGSDTLDYDDVDGYYIIAFERETKDHYNPSSGSGASVKTITEKYTIGAQTAGATIQLPNNGGTNASWAVITGEDGGTATVSVVNGLVTFTTAGTAVVQVTWQVTTSIGEDQTWEPTPNNNAEGTETDPIITWHFVDMTGEDVTPPNVVVSYLYSGSKDSNNKVTLVYEITINNTSGEDLLFIVDSLKLSYSSEPDATYVVIVKYGSQTTEITSQGQTVLIP